MKSIQNIGEAISKGLLLQKEKESENNWNKIDIVLSRISEVEKEREALDALSLGKLVCMGIQSNRSKLSGTGCRCLARLSELLKNQMKDLLVFVIPALILSLGKTNKVISSRALSTLEIVSSHCNLKIVSRYLRSSMNSPSKIVRLGVVEASLRGLRHEVVGEYLEVLEIAAGDAAVEVREKARAGIRDLVDFDRKLFVDMIKRLPEKIAKFIPVKDVVVNLSGDKIGSGLVVNLSGDKISNSLDKISNNLSSSLDKEVGDKPVASVISSVVTPQREAYIKIKDSGSGVVVRGPIRAFAMPSRPVPEPKPTLKPGYSIERVGIRLEEHQREIEEVLRKSTPRKTPLSKKRLREGAETPSCITKKEKESGVDQNENDLANLSLDIMNLSISQIEDTDQIVQVKEVNDSIFSGDEVGRVNKFVLSCEVAAKESQTGEDMNEYSILASEVAINRATTRKEK
ncbi:hypothetical protein NEHOM01_1668 [Nematocida homosporus]|uniref:uncharacterized protein n=1 Tax=Nematocida homosporus TaxID=1912981 RepID=UPI002220190B|nr:uncharacterized protein NEHOM01_1668 [Nematocida homosporus]KAI5186737.1 hypothetical protein NEHOM01_1668 [Nematocida homosporus]